MIRLFSLFASLVILFSSCQQKSNQEQTGSKIKNHLAEWQADKFGMFIHWGLYSIPAGVWKGKQIPFYSEQIMNHARIPANEYEQLAKEFNPHQWNAEEVVLLAKKAGMRYIVFTTKHHDGFCMFKTATTPYNVVDATPYGRDVVKELSEACAKHGIKLGFYYSLPDWHYPKGIHREAPDTSTTCREHVNQLYSPLEIVTPELEEYIVQQVSELLTNYGDIETIWFDMGLVTPEQSKRFRQTVHNLQPNCLVNGRVMNNQGDYFTLTDNSEVVGMTQWAWDNPASLYGTWGYRSWEKRGEPSEQVHRQLNRLMNTISSGGVFLLNIGPTGEGEIIPYEKEVLTQIGEWVEAHHEAIYDTKPSPFEKLPNAYCTQKNNKLFFTVHGNDSVIQCRNLITPIQKAYLLENPENVLSIQPIDQGIEILLPTHPSGKLYTVVAEMADSVLQILPYYLIPQKGSFLLSDENTTTYPQVEGTGYISMQPESNKVWHLDIQEAGLYNISIDYIPAYPNRTYTFEFSDGTSLKQDLPGIDSWLQTSVVGTVQLSAGKKDFCVYGSSDYPPLAPLGLQIHTLRIKKINQ